MEMSRVVTDFTLGESDVGTRDEARVPLRDLVMGVERTSNPARTPALIPHNHCT